MNENTYIQLKFNKYTPWAYNNGIFISIQMHISLSFYLKMSYRVQHMINDREKEHGFQKIMTKQTNNHGFFNDQIWTCYFQSS